MTIPEAWQTNSIADLGEEVGREIFRLGLEQAQLIAPDRPIGADENAEVDQWAILERAAQKLPLLLWADDPILGADLLGDLVRLRRQFLGPDHPSLPQLQAYQQLARRQSRTVPDPRIVKGTDEWEKQERRMRRG